MSLKMDIVNTLLTLDTDMAEVVCDCLIKQFIYTASLNGHSVFLIRLLGSNGYTV